MPSPVTFHPFSAADLEAYTAHQKRYLQAHPQAPAVPGEAYLSPAFEGGNLLRCAKDASGQLLAYAVYYPVGDMAWVEIRSLPELSQSETLRDPLFDWLVQQAQQHGQKKLAFQYTPGELQGIGYAQSKGGAFSYSIFTMRRSLDKPIPGCPLPPGFTLRHMRLLDKAGQRQYVDARNECFPEAQTTLEEWQYFAGSPWWAQGVCVAAFSGEILASGVTVYWEPGSSQGFTEYIFTRSPYRGKGLARALITEALGYLQAQGKQAAQLEVKAENETALGLYLGLGYQVTGQSSVYEVWL